MQEYGCFWMMSDWRRGVSVTVGSDGSDGACCARAAIDADEATL